MQTLTEVDNRKMSQYCNTTAGITNITTTTTTTTTIYYLHHYHYSLESQIAHQR